MAASVRVAVLGGTRFIGRAAVAALVHGGHEVLVCHRGETEPGDLSDAERDVRHVHADRARLAEPDVRQQIEAFGPEAVVDCMAMTRAGARAVLDALPDPDLRWVVLSSQDVYRAFETLERGGPATDAVPIDEDSPVRTSRYPYPDAMPEYSKLDVEEDVAARGGCVLRLPMVFGPRDGQRREEFVLRRVRAGRRRIPIGTASGLLPFGFVDDIGRGIAAAAVDPSSAGRLYNLCEEKGRPMRQWVEDVLTAAAFDGELVAVPDSALPPDLGLTAALSQPLYVSSARARAELGYTDTPTAEAVAASVAWHLDHPPPAATEPDDWSGDEAALSSATSEEGDTAG